MSASLRSSKSGFSLGRIALPLLLAASAASAAPSLVVTSQGPATDNAGHVTSGWTGLLLTLNADPTYQIAAVDVGQFSNSTNGIFATLLQDWTPSSKFGPAPTPVGHSTTDTNGSDDGTDSHILVTQRNVAVTDPFENSDQLTPPGAPANDAFNSYGTGSWLRGVFGITPAYRSGSQPLAYLVVPDGSAVSYSMDLAEAMPGQQSLPPFKLTGSFIPPSAVIPEPSGVALLLIAAPMLHRRRRR